MVRIFQNASIVKPSRLGFPKRIFKNQERAHRSPFRSKRRTNGTGKLHTLFFVAFFDVHFVWSKCTSFQEIKAIDAPTVRRRKR
jgi:hypothetical protein